MERGGDWPPRATTVTIVFIPMVVAMYYHLFPNDTERAGMRCSCALHPHLVTT